MALSITMESRDDPRSGSALSDDSVAYLRLTLGVNIFLHGLTRLLGDHAVFLAYLEKTLRPASLSPSFLAIFATILPWCEAAIGFLMLIGLFTRAALIAGALLMTALMVGICLAQDWQTAGLQLIYCLIYFVLLTLRSRNLLSLDAWWMSRQQT